jgi:ABC-2 type transport system permease protein
MPIHDQGYRRYRGSRAAGRGWWVIARAGLLERIRERRFLALLLFAWSPFLVRAVQIYVASAFPQAAFLAATPETFREFLNQQGIFVFFVTIYVGAGLISADRRANALQIYLAKPLTRTEYVAGKLTILGVFLIAVTWVPAMLLLLLQLVLAGSVAFVRANLFLIPAVTLFAIVQVATSALAMLALSSLSKNGRFVGMMYAGIVFFTAAMFQVLRAITGNRRWALISPQDTLDAIGAGIFRVERAGDAPLAMSLLMVALLVGASLWVLDRRVRGVDVVA